MAVIEMQVYHGISTAVEVDTRRPAGVYNCPECRDASITWRHPVDKYKVRCPKCNSDMVRVAKIKMPVVAPLASYGKEIRKGAAIGATLGAVGGAGSTALGLKALGGKLKKLK